MSDQKDTLFQDRDAPIGSFRFDHQVASVFDDMISRSVPGYGQILYLLPTLTRLFATPNAQYYDLGCSTGAGLAAMADGLADTPAALIGIDNSPPMLEQARRMLQPVHDQAHLSLQLVQADLAEIELSNAAMVLMNFTLQFIPLDERCALLQRIWDGLRPGGALVLSEKLVSSRERVDRWLTRIHHQYKADQGYSELEISKKRDAIENVLIPETLETHQARLEDAGFNTVFPWMRNLQFVSILAIK